MKNVIIQAYHNEPRYETKDTKYSNLFNAKASNKPTWIKIK